MKISGFEAKGDIVGRRANIRWDFIPEGTETLADAPPVTLCRKLRDFTFPDVSRRQRHVLYDAKMFPPEPVSGTLGVTDLPSWEVTGDGTRTVYEPISVSVPYNGREVEIFRRTIGTVYGPDGVPVKQCVEIVDAGPHPGALLPNTVYYYQLFGEGLSQSGSDAAAYRGTAMITDGYGLNQTLYASLPDIYRRHDVSLRPDSTGTGTVPEFSAGSAGQLRRFLDPFGLTLDSMRGTAEGLRTLQDIDATDARFLEPLARWIGWDFGAGSDIPVQRNELKNASRLYRVVGSVPGLRALVAQYTGWSTQIAEFAQNLALSNRPPQYNLFAITPDSSGAGWHGAEDAAQTLGFAVGNQRSDASGSIKSSISGPYALRPAMELTIRADGLPGNTVRFQSGGDFADIGAATAAEVAAVINRELSDVAASDTSGRLELRSKTTGEGSNVQVVPASSSLVSLENAPGGRFSALTDSLGRIRLFYETWDTPTSTTDTRSSAVGESGGVAAGNQVRRRVHYKSFAYGAWRDSHPIFPEAGAAQADPAAALLTDGRILLAWLDEPQTGNSRLRYAIGTARAPMPARLTANPRGPLALTAGNGMTFVGDGTTERFTINAADFGSPARASADELVLAMNRQLTHVVASREKDGSIRIDSRATGIGAKIAIDLRASNTARAVGFDRHSAIGAPGSWSEEIDWSGPFDVDAVRAGDHAELAAAADPAGGVRLAWTSHVNGRWLIQAAHWDERVTIGTANGLFVRDGASAWTKVTVGMPSDDIRAVAVDADGTTWIATGSGLVLRRRNGTVTTPVPALPSNDVRQIVLAPDGTAWFATAAGLLSRPPASNVVAVSPGLPIPDVRAIALYPDGTLWVATAAGAVMREPAGDVTVIDADSGLPSLDVRDVAIDADGTVYFATAAGLAIKRSAGFGRGGFDFVNMRNGLRSDNVRSVRLGADGALWVATDRGVSNRSASGGAWITFDTLQGLASNDVRSLSISSVGEVWVITAAGTSVIRRDLSLSTLDLVSGVADPAVRSVHAGWSAFRELANGGVSNREPALSVDENNRTWLLWSQQGNDGTGSWTLHSRIQDPATMAWTADTPLTAVVAGKPSSDRTASAMRQPGGMRIYFGSDRNGGSGLWMVDVSLAGAIGQPVSIGNHASSELAPAPINIGGAVWLFYRSDRNVPLAQVGGTVTGGSDTSARVSDIGTLRRFAGSLALDLSDVERLRTRRSFGDLLCYTPNRPDSAGPLGEDELYTRGTVAFYVSAGKRGSPLTQHEVGRLRELLAQFTPANLRALVIVVILDDAEFVYGAGTDIGERYRIAIRLPTRSVLCQRRPE